MEGSRRRGGALEGLSGGRRRGAQAGRERQGASAGIAVGVRVTPAWSCAVPNPLDRQSDPALGDVNSASAVTTIRSPVAGGGAGAPE
jgi:hypothetical protein